MIQKKKLGEFFCFQCSFFVSWRSALVLLASASAFAKYPQAQNKMDDKDSGKQSQSNTHSQRKTTTIRADKLLMIFLMSLLRFWMIILKSPLRADLPIVI